MCCASCTRDSGNLLTLRGEYVLLAAADDLVFAQMHSWGGGHAVSVL